MMRLSNETERKEFHRSLPRVVRRKVCEAYDIFNGKTDQQKASLLYYHIVKRGNYDILMTAIDKWKEYKKKQDELMNKLSAKVSELVEVADD